MKKVSCINCGTEMYVVDVGGGRKKKQQQKGKQTVVGLGPTIIKRR